jgi:hypothetical protein
MPDPSSADAAKDGLRRFFLPPLWLLFFLDNVCEEEVSGRREVFDILTPGWEVWRADGSGRRGGGLGGGCGFSLGEGGTDILEISSQEMRF